MLCTVHIFLVKGFWASSSWLGGPCTMCYSKNMMQYIFEAFPCFLPVPKDWNFPSQWYVSTYLCQCSKGSRSSRTDPVRVPKFPDRDRYEFHFQKTWIGSVRNEVFYENSRTDPFRVVPDVGPNFYTHCIKKINWN